MTTRIMFTQGSSPLRGVDVRFGQDDEIHQTDDDGVVQVDLPVGHHSARLDYGGTPVTVDIELPEDESLQVVDVGAQLDRATADTQALPGDIPQVIDGRYHVEHLLGRGGMGVVVKARDQLLERRVAIKFLNQQFAQSDEAREVFLKEARSLAKLRHERLVAVHDVTVDGDKPVMVTEFVEGTDLADRLQEIGAMSARQAVSVTRRIAEGLGHMHEHGLIHRDIKPGNIISQDNGDLKLIDFGLARSLEHLTNKGTRVRGTPAYMAPEQVQGEALGPPTDIYQLGVTLFEFLTGEVPFPDDPYGLAHVQKDIPSIREIAPEVPAPLAELVERCMAKDPADRPRDGNALLAALNTLEADAPTGIPVTQQGGWDAARDVPPSATPPAGDTGSASGASAPDIEAPEASEASETGWTEIDALPPNHSLRRVAIVLAVGIVSAGAVLAFWPSGDDRGEEPSGAEEMRADAPAEPDPGSADEPGNATTGSDNSAQPTPDEGSAGGVAAGSDEAADQKADESSEDAGLAATETADAGRADPSSTSTKDEPTSNDGSESARSGARRAGDQNEQQQGNETAGSAADQTASEETASGRGESPVGAAGSRPDSSDESAEAPSRADDQQPSEEQSSDEQPSDEEIVEELPELNAEEPSEKPDKPANAPEDAPEPEEKTVEKSDESSPSETENNAGETSGESTDSSESGESADSSDKPAEDDKKPAGDKENPDKPPSRFF